MIFNVDLKCKMVAENENDDLFELDYHLESMATDGIEVTVSKMYSERFEVEKVDVEQTGGYYYRIKDNLDEMRTVGFPYRDDAFTICEQLNRLYGNGS